MLAKNKSLRDVTRERERVNREICEQMSKEFDDGRIYSDSVGFTIKIDDLTEVQARKVLAFLKSEGISECE